MGLVNPIQRRREETKRELSLRIESRASKDSRLFLGRQWRLRGDRDSAKATSPSQDPKQPHPRPPLCEGSSLPSCPISAHRITLPTDKTACGIFPGIYGNRGNSWVFPRICLLLCVYSQRSALESRLPPALHPQPLFGFPDHISSPDWRASPPPFRAAGPASACPEQRSQNSPGLAHLGRKCLPRKLRP